MKQSILFLCLAISTFCFGQNKNTLKDIHSIKFYGVDFSQAKVFGADETTAQFKAAFRGINELFIIEAKKYDVGKHLKKEVTEISLEAVNQVNSAINEENLMTSQTNYSLNNGQVEAAIQALPIRQVPGVGMVLIAEFLNKPANKASYKIVFFNTETKEIIEEWISEGKARGFGLRNYWAGSVYSVLKNL